MKDVRLPYGFDSWTQLVKDIVTQDEINFNNNKGKFYHTVIVSPELKDCKPYAVDIADHESFECDVLTLKLRAFDELKEIIPNAEELRNAKYELYNFMSQGVIPQELNENKAIKLIDNMLKLLGKETTDY